MSFLLEFEKYVASKIKTMFDAKVDKTTTVNGKPLSSNVTIAPGDISGLAASATTDATDLVNDTIRGTFTPNNTPIISGDTGLAIAEKAQGQINAISTSVDAARKVFYASPTGLSSNSGNTPNTAVDFATALTKAGNSGNEICVLPGTYSGNFTIPNLNLTITSLGMERGGLCNFTGTFSITGASSSVRLSGITVDTLDHTGATTLYLYSCKVNTALNSTGGGLQMEMCDTQGVALTGTVTLSGSGVKNLVGGNFIGFLTITGATTTVRLSNNFVVAPITITGGTLALGGENPVYAASGTGNAITATAPGGLGTTVVIINGASMLTPSNTAARVSIGANVVYGIRGCFFDRVNSTLAGTVSSQTFFTDVIDAQAPTAAVNTNSTQIATTAFVLNQAASTAPLQNNAVAAVGTSTRFARGDHVHQTQMPLTFTDYSNLASRQTETIYQNNTNSLRLVWISTASAAPGLNVILKMGSSNALGMRREQRTSTGAANGFDLSVPPGWFYKIEFTVNGSPQTAASLNSWYEAT